MSFEDKSIQCSDCGITFTFSVEDQEFFSSKVTPTSPSAARNVAGHGSQNALAAAITELRARCSRLPAPSAVKIPKSRFNLAVIGPFTAAIAIVKTD